MWIHGIWIAYKTCRLWSVLKALSQGFRIAYKTCRLWRVLHTGSGSFFYQKCSLRPFFIIFSQTIIFSSWPELKTWKTIFKGKHFWKWNSGKRFFQDGGEVIIKDFGQENIMGQAARDTSGTLLYFISFLSWCWFLLLLKWTVKDLKKI